MQHKIRGKKLNRTTSHRSAMFANMVVALVMNEQIKTTLAKAKWLRPYVERLITKSKVASLAIRRSILAKIRDKNAVEKLIAVLGKRYINRPGGYTRIIKTGSRYGDMADMAVIELIDRDINAKGSMTCQVLNNSKEEQI